MLRLKDILKTSLKRLLEVVLSIYVFLFFLPIIFVYSFSISLFLSFFYLDFLTSLEIQNIVFLNIMLIYILKHFFYITTYRIIYFNMLCYKKNVHIKINAILNKTNILQFFDGRDHHLLTVSVEQQYVRNPFVKIKYDRTIITKIFVLLIICICDFINKVQNILTELV